MYEATLNLLKLFAPILPYITEEIYHLYFAKIENLKSIHNSQWPQYNSNFVDSKAERAGDYATSIISAVRKFKSEKSLSLKEEISLLSVQCSPPVRKLLELVLPDIMATAKIKDFEFGKGDIEVSDIKIKIQL